MHSKADLHVHSKYSDRPNEWLLRRIGAPESFVEPTDLYHRCRERGMDFVTITDHNTIRGALEIAHLPNAFVSAKVTTYFPEEKAKVHLLVWGITAGQFEEIQRCRPNIFELQRYLHEQRIPVAVAYPLFRVNNALTVDQFEKLVLLFERFEVINGTRNERANQILDVVLANLNPQQIERMARRHRIEPHGQEPWNKCLVGGSGDYSGIYEAGAYTSTPKADSVEEFLENLRTRQHTPHGSGGASLRLAHGYYHIAYDYYKSRFLNGGQRDLVGEMLRRMLEGPKPAPATLGQTVFDFAKRMVTSYHRANLKPTERMLVDECTQLFSQHYADIHSRVPKPSDDERNFHLACQISDQLGYAFFREFLKYTQRGQLLESLQTLFSLAPVALSIAPYLAAFRTHHKDEGFWQQVALRFPAAGHLRYRSEKKAWLTDTFADLNGVSRTIRTLSRVAKQEGRDLTVITCLDETPDVDFPVKNFVPVGSCPLPEYASQILAAPPMLEVIEYLEREQFSELIISTPGPVGLTGLIAGRLLGLKLSGIYHTDFPRYVASLTDDTTMEHFTWRYMLWFYGQMETIFAPSEAYREDLADQGLDRDRIHIMKRGVDFSTFGPHFRTPDFWQRWDLPAGLKFLYVGRVSREKGLHQLVDSFYELQRSSEKPCQLVIVGEGPILPELREQCKHEPSILFTGALHGEDLAQAYASADVFVFPSTTDTFGNAVLEAQASGLPAIVTTEGGPQEIIARTNSGLKVDLAEPGTLSEAMQRILTDDALRADLAERALENARQSTWEKVLDEVWFAGQPKPEETTREEDLVGVSS